MCQSRGENYHGVLAHSHSEGAIFHAWRGVFEGRSQRDNGFVLGRCSISQRGANRVSVLRPSVMEIGNTAAFPVLFRFMILIPLYEATAPGMFQFMSRFPICTLEVLAPAQSLKSPSATERTEKRNALIPCDMTDEWNERLRCPNCGKMGMAGLSQGDQADTPTVHSVPDGFKIIATLHGPVFRCRACNVAVMP